jgi:hypothetical protein
VSPEDASMWKLVGQWITPEMRLGQARSAEPPVLTLMMFKIGPFNPPETSPTTGGSPERGETTISRTMVSEIG